MIRAGRGGGKTSEAVLFGSFTGLRVTAAAGIRLSTRKVYKVDTLERKLAGLVNPDVDFDSANRSGRSRAVGCCRDIS